MLRKLLHIFAGSAFSDAKFPVNKMFKHFIIQKIFRKNGHVPWPVHPTSVIKSPQKNCLCLGRVTDINVQL